MRRGLALGIVLLSVGAVSVASSAPARDGDLAPRLYGLRVSSGVPFAGDRSLLATVSPNGDGLRDRAIARFRLDRAATVKLRVVVCGKHPKTLLILTGHFGPGRHHFEWTPRPATLPQTYLLRAIVIGRNGARRVYGSPHHQHARVQPAPVVRVMGIDAGFTERSYSPGAVARLRIATDVPSFTLQLFQAGPETEPTGGYAMQGFPVDRPLQIDWSTHRDAPGMLSVHVGDWPNGIYFARLTAPDGRNYSAPLIVRPHPFGLHRIAVVVHTNTWQAYNHQDVDGDGWGDTWYASDDIRHVDLSRPYIRGGAPPHWRTYDLPFVHWLYKNRKEVDFLSDDDLSSFLHASSLARLYDLIVFPGHEEYVTDHMYDLIAGYRNLGGNLMFLSSTNLLWRVDRRGDRITRIAQWRQLGRPEARIVGVQYRSNDEGGHRGAYVLTAFGRDSWQFLGVDQHAFSLWRWLGIEFDMTTRRSPPGTRVLARVDPHLRDRRVRGEMTYYDFRGAKVFAAGTLDFPAALAYPQFRRLLANLWDRLAVP